MYMLPYSVDGVLVATLPVVMLRTDRGDAYLEEFRDVVDQGEDDDGDDEGSARVLLPETIDFFWATLDFTKPDCCTG